MLWVCLVPFLIRNFLFSALPCMVFGQHWILSQNDIKISPFLNAASDRYIKTITYRLLSGHLTFTFISATLSNSTERLNILACYAPRLGGNLQWNVVCGTCSRDWMAWVYSAVTKVSANSLHVECRYIKRNRTYRGAHPFQIAMLNIVVLRPQHGAPGKQNIPKQRKTMKKIKHPTSLQLPSTTGMDEINFWWVSFWPFQCPRPGSRWGAYQFIWLEHPPATPPVPERRR